MGQRETQDQEPERRIAERRTIDRRRHVGPSEQDKRSMPALVAGEFYALADQLERCASDDEAAARNGRLTGDIYKDMVQWLEGRAAGYRLAADEIRKTCR